MQITYLATAIFMSYGIHAQQNNNAAAGAKVASAGRATAPGEKQPNLIPMNCTQAYLPFSEADVAALSANDTKTASNGNCMFLLLGLPKVSPHTENDFST
jgi:hypothetical protein